MVSPGLQQAPSLDAASPPGVVVPEWDVSSAAWDIEEVPLMPRRLSATDDGLARVAFLSSLHQRTRTSDISQRGGTDRWTLHSDMAGRH